MSKCAFCNVVAGKTPVDIVYEDAALLAFLHLAPLHKGHTLVIPKAHHPSITTVPGGLMQQLMMRASDIGVAAMRAAEAQGFALHIDNGACAGQLVPHVHVHVIPRSPDDGIAPPPWTANYTTDAQKTELLGTMRERLNK